MKYSHYVAKHIEMKKLDTPIYNIIKAIHSLRIEDQFSIAFGVLKNLANITGVNLIDNYGYREYTVIETLKKFFPSIKKTPGRTGDDANAIGEGMERIELKSGTSESKILKVKDFPKMEFDKQSDEARRNYIFTYDGLFVSYFEYYVPFATVIIHVPKEHIHKLHPLFEKKQEEKLKDFAEKKLKGKKIGRDSITVSLPDVLSVIEKEHLRIFHNDEEVNVVDFFKKLENREIKINCDEI